MKHWVHFVLPQYRCQEVLRHQPVAEGADSAAHLVERVVPAARGDRGVGRAASGDIFNPFCKEIFLDPPTPNFLISIAHTFRFNHFYH